jgi:hypothetical protein
MRSNLNERFPLLPGSHRTRADGMCAMEMVAWLAGEPHSDGPSCTCPVIAAFVRAFNDFLPDADARDRWLRRLLPRLIHTVASREVERERGLIAVDRAVRVLAPLAAAARGDLELAALLRALPPATEGGGALREIARALPPHAPRAITWIVARAAQGSAPVSWVAGAVHVARLAGSEAAWSECARLLEDMARAGRAPGAPRHRTRCTNHQWWPSRSMAR